MFDYKEILNDLLTKQYLFSTEHYNITKYPLHFGYNLIFSGRGGGKSTSVLIFALRSYIMQNVTTLLLRACKDEVTTQYMSMYLNTLKKIVFDDGKNLIEKLSDNKYNDFYYNKNRHCFILCKHTDNIDDIKNNDPFMYVSSIDKSSQLCSSFSALNCKIIFFEECIDDKNTYNTTLNLLHDISTCFRECTDTIVFLTGNLSRGNNIILQDFKLYDIIKSSKTDFISHRNKDNTLFYITLYDSIPQKDSQKAKFNDMYFGIDIKGIDVIRGNSNPIPLYRDLPKDTILNKNDIKVRLFLFDRWYKIEYCDFKKYQSMYYVTEIDNYTPCSDCLTFTDNELFAYQNPYTYYNVGKYFEILIDFIKHTRRTDTCYDSYMSYISIKNWLDMFFIPDNI